LADTAAATARAQATVQLQEALRNGLPALLAAAPALKDPDALIEAMVEVATSRARFALPMAAATPEDPWGTLLAVAPGLVGRRLLRDAVVAAHPMCAAVGMAVEAGVELRVRTTAPRGSTDNRAYEAGRLLRVLGVHSDAAPGWDLRLIRPRGAIAG
jgi:hypothetical protein